MDSYTTAVLQLQSYAPFFNMSFLAESGIFFLPLHKYKNVKRWIQMSTFWYFTDFSCGNLFTVIT